MGIETMMAAADTRHFVSLASQALSPSFLLLAVWLTVLQPTGVKLGEGLGIRL